MIFDELLKISKKIKGTVICIGLNHEKIINVILKNKSILKCDLLNSNYEDKKNKQAMKKQKKIKLRKKYKKNSIDVIFLDMEQIVKNKKTIVKDTVNICKGKIYLYDVDGIKEDIKKYRKYTSNIEIREYNDGTIYIIDVSNIKKSKLKDFYISFICSIQNSIDFISDMLVS